MSAVLSSKDIILTFLGLFLSIVFSQGLFPRVLVFVIEFARGIMAFGYNLNIDSDGRITSEVTNHIHKFKIDKANKLNKIKKCISCNTAIAMTTLVVGISAISLKIIGVNINNFDIIWGLFLNISFVYLSYSLWAFFRKKEWKNMPVLTRSRYNFLLSLEAILLILYALLVLRGALNLLIYIALGLVVIAIGTRLHRIPHFNLTYRPIIDFEETEEFYLLDIKTETIIISSVFLILLLLHLFVFPLISASQIGGYIDIHPIRTFSTIISIPFMVFLVKFVRIVGVSAILRYVFYIHRSPMPEPNLTSPPTPDKTA